VAASAVAATAMAATAKSASAGATIVITRQVIVRNLKNGEFRERGLGNLSDRRRCPHRRGNCHNNQNRQPPQVDP
jgi:hypothetical protein